MNPNAIRREILRCVAEHEATNSSSFLDDVDIAAAIAAPLADVQPQMLILESMELLEVGKTFGPTYDARLTPKGMLAVEQLDVSPPVEDGPNRLIGF